VVCPVIAVELARGTEGIRLPTGPIVHRHLGVPLREVPRATAASLSPRRGGRPSVPLEHDAHGVARRERARELEVRDRAVWRTRIIHEDGGAVYRGRNRESLVPEIRIREALEAHSALALVVGAPPGAGPESVEILMHVHLAERVR